MTNGPTPQWLGTPLGERVHALERKLLAEALSQVFGWQLLQIGHWGSSEALLAEARTQRKAVLARDTLNPPNEPRMLRICSRTDALSIASDSVDAVLLPHTLEYEPDPHELLREVERILLGDGHVIVLGFRPFSGWGCRHLLASAGFPPGAERLIGERRLRDWLKLLGFEVVDAHPKISRDRRRTALAAVRGRLSHEGPQTSLRTGADPAALADTDPGRRRAHRTHDSKQKLGAWCAGKS